MMKSTRLLLFPFAALLICVVFPLKAQAACRGSSPNRTAPTWADLQTCINRASSGDTITLGPGMQTAGLHSGIVIPSTKALTIDGNRQNGTKVIDSICPAACGYMDPPLFHIEGSSMGQTTLRNFDIVPGTSTHTGGIFMIMIKSNPGPYPVRVTNNRYTMDGRQGDMIQARTNRILIDHNEMSNLPTGNSCFTANSGFLGITVESGNTRTTAALWMQPMKWGALDVNNENAYVEANTLINLSQGSSDMSDNSRTVWRFNKMMSSPVSSHGSDTGFVGLRGWEIYGNRWSYDGTPQPTCNPPELNQSIPNGWLYIRGGSVRILANVIPNVYTGQSWGTINGNRMQVQNLNRNSGNYPCWKGGRPFPGQLGWGWINGTGAGPFPPLGMTTALEPIIFAGNTGPIMLGPAPGTSNVPASYVNPGVDIGIGATEAYSCQLNNPSFVADPVSDYVQANREYFAQAGDGGENTATATPFNGTTGTGYGMRQYRPATCTTGVYYWATDQGNWNHNTDPSLYMKQGVLDKCENGAWHDAWYVPFVYPHPLDVDRPTDIQTDHQSR